MAMGEGSTVWPSRFPRCAVAGAALACLAGWGLYRLWSSSNPEQAFYLSEYATTSVYSWGKPRQFDVLLPDGTPTTALLSPVGFNRWLEKDIYHSEPVWKSAEWHLYTFGFLFVVGLFSGGILDAKRNRGLRKGRILRGPQMRTWRQFNRLTKGDGFRFQCAPGKTIAMPLAKETQHIQICGDTGTGKSTITRDLLKQIRERGELAIVFDPDGEYYKEFGTSDDWNINPTLECCPWWDLGAEADDEAEGKAVINGIIPESSESDKKFFNRSARDIANVLNAVYKPDANEFGWWLSNTNEIAQRLVGTPQENALPLKASPGQAAAVLTELAAPSLALRMMPPKSDDRRRFACKDYVANPKGWIFLTSTPDIADAVIPLQSALIDILILKLQSRSDTSQKFYISLDELQAFRRMPQLETGVTRGRKFNISFILSFQGLSQLEATYGEKTARTITSQAYTNVICRSSDPSLRKHLEERIGLQEIERLRENRQAGSTPMSRKGVSYSTETVAKPVVMASEIGIIPDLRAYFVQGGSVVKISVTPRPRQVRMAPPAKRKIPLAGSIGEGVAPEVEAITEPEPASVAETARPKRSFAPATEEPSLFN